MIVDVDVNVVVDVDVDGDGDVVEHHRVSSRPSGPALWAVLSVLSLLTACNRTQPPSPAPAALVPPEGHGAPVSPLPDPELTGGHVGRAPRRINVAQLAASIEVTTGHTWASLDALAPSLGRADYAQVNAESLEPNLVFAKFLEDGAREVCLATAKDDLNRPLANDRVLSREVPESIAVLTDIDDATARRNLEYLSVRFWGQRLSGAELDAWAVRFKAMAARAEAIGRREQAWTALCVALMTDPRFVTY